MQQVVLHPRLGRQGEVRDLHLSEACCASPLKSVGQGAVSLHPLVFAFFGSGAHESGYPSPVSAQREGVGSTMEMVSRTRNAKGISVAPAFLAQTPSDPSLIDHRLRKLKRGEQ